MLFRSHFQKVRNTSTPGTSWYRYLGAADLEVRVNEGTGKILEQRQAEPSPLTLEEERLEISIEYSQTLIEIEDQVDSLRYELEKLMAKLGEVAEKVDRLNADI